MNEKNIELGGKEKSSENNNDINNIVKEGNNYNNINEDKIIDKKKKAKTEFNE